MAYAKAALAVLTTENTAPEVTDYERWMLSNFSDEELHYSKSVASGCVSCDNKYNTIDLKKFETSMYGLWRKIVRAVKNLRKSDPVEWIKDRPGAIADETKKGVSWVKKKVGILKDDLTEPAIRIGLKSVSRTLMLINEDYRNCRSEAHRTSDREDRFFEAKKSRCHNVAMAKVRIGLGPLKRLIKEDKYRFQFNDMMRRDKFNKFLIDFRDVIYVLESVHPEYKGYFNWLPGL